MARKMKNKLGNAVNPVPVKIVPQSSEPYKPSAEDKAREMKYRAEDALRDIERAEKHKSDKELMKHVSSLAKEKVNSLKKLC